MTQRIGYLLITIALVLVAVPSHSKPKSSPFIVIGMTRAQVMKVLPKYADYFKASNPGVQITDYNYHGMQGNVSFVFKDNVLKLFSWQHQISGSVINDAELAEYAGVLKGIRTDLGQPKRYETSTIDSRVGLCFWRLPSSSGHTSYMNGLLKFQIIDNDYLDSLRPH